MIPSKRQLELIQLIQQLHPGKRHRVTLICRGTEPWEVLEHVEETKIQLAPPLEGERLREGAMAA